MENVLNRLSDAPLKYGNLPTDMGYFYAPTDEMMFWLYCPISIPGVLHTYLPDNLWQFKSLIEAIRWDDLLAFHTNYVYLTAKTIWSTPASVGNRPGWHTDGFGTDDVNYIWYDRAPTEFIAGSFDLPSGCEESMAAMDQAALGAEIITYPAKHLLRLDQTVIHRCPVDFDPGMRTFIKVSLSRDRYDLIGNSVNHNLPEQWPLVPREPTRNHPASRQANQG